MLTTSPDFYFKYFFFHCMSSKITVEKNFISKDITLIKKHRAKSLLV